MPRDQPTELDFSSKMRFAFKKHTGLLLSTSEVDILAKFDLTSCDFAPQTRREYTDYFQSMVKRAKKIRGNGLGLELSRCGGVRYRLQSFVDVRHVMFSGGEIQGVPAILR